MQKIEQSENSITFQLDEGENLVILKARINLEQSFNEWIKLWSVNNLKTQSTINCQFIKTINILHKITDKQWITKPEIQLLEESITPNGNSSSFHFYFTDCLTLLHLQSIVKQLQKFFQ